MILVLTANSSSCRIYHYNKSPKQLKLLKEIIHPENKLKNGDLTSDRSGRYQTPRASRGAYSPHMDAKDIKIDSFIREIANELNLERTKQDYKKFIVIVPPHINGLLFQHLDKHVKNLIDHNIKKDLHQLTDKELLDFLQTKTQFPDE